MTQDSKSAWGLWSSLVETVTTTVKQKSDEIINIYKEDLQEFSRTIVSDTSAVIKDKVDKLSSHDNKSTRATNTSHQMARVLRIQRDPKTYSEQPSDEAEYSTWSANFNVGAPENTEAITHLLTTNEIVREFHTAMVPTKVLYRDFWCRYYFRIHKLEEEEKRRAAILNNANANDDEDFSWDAEDDGSSAKSNAPPKHTPSTHSDTTTTTTPDNTPSKTEHTTTVSKDNDIPTNTMKDTKDTKDTKDKAEIDNDSNWGDKGDEGTEDAKDEKVERVNEKKVQEEKENEEEILQDEKDDIDEEIARKFESQKLGKLEQKSDAEDGWADWE